MLLPRKARIDAPGVLHHIIVSGIERRKIFYDDPKAGKKTKFSKELLVARMRQEKRGTGLKLRVSILLVKAWGQVRSGEPLDILQIISFSCLRCFFCVVAKKSQYSRTLQRDLNNLIELNLVRLKGPARQSNYELAK